MFSNFGGGKTSNQIYSSDGKNTKQTEWAVNPTPFLLTPLTHFYAKHYYKNHQLLNSLFFPIKEATNNTTNNLNNSISLPKVQRRNSGFNNVKKHLNLVLKFAIVLLLKFISG